MFAKYAKVKLLSAVLLFKPIPSTLRLGLYIMPYLHQKAHQIFIMLAVLRLSVNRVAGSITRGAERNFGPRSKIFVWTLSSVVPQNHVMSKKRPIASADVQISVQHLVMNKIRS